MEPYLRAGVLENYRVTVERLGGDPDSLLVRAGVAREALDIAGTYLPYHNYLQLHHITAQDLRCPHFGLEMSRVASAETLGITGFIMLQAETVGEAWSTLVQFNRYHDNYGEVALLERDGLVGMEYRLPQADLPGSRGAFDTAASIAVNIMRQFCGAQWQPHCIVQPYAAPDELAPFAHLGAGKLEFGGEAFQMYFPRSAMEVSLRSNHPGIRRVLGNYLDSVAAAGASSTRAQVEELIRGLLPQDWTFRLEVPGQARDGMEGQAKIRRPEGRRLSLGRKILLIGSPGSYRLPFRRS